MSEQEMTNITAALKNPEFRKLLAEYCNEMADPKNQALYEQELTQYEAERGIDLTFITPQPGFVIKTVVDGREKAFINVSRNPKVDRPTSRYASDDTGRRGLHWSIPLTQAPPREDYDNKKQKCTVYDVVFNTDTLHLAARNREFRQLVINTACDAVEHAFQVSLDRANLRFPKMTFKGTARPTVIRKKLNTHQPINRSSSSESEGHEEGSFTDQFYPEVDLKHLNGDQAPTVIKAKQEQPEEKYTTPKYKLVHRRGVEMHELTHERDAKLNTTLPKELVITVELPQLKTSQNVKLDVREHELELVSEQPAKYRLNLSLPYAVLGDNGTAKFDSGKRQLVVTLPVNRSADMKLGDLTRVLAKQASDSGLDSPSSHSHSSDEERESSFGSNPVERSEWKKSKTMQAEDKFLDRNTAYQLPTFTANVLDNEVVFTLNVKNVDPSSVVVEQEKENGVHLKFFSLGSGYAPIHYAFYVQFVGAVSFVSHSAEAWDNNVVLQLELDAVPAEYRVGKSPVMGELASGFLKAVATGTSFDKTENEPQKEAFGIQVREGKGAREMTIELSKKEEEAEEGDEDVFHEDEATTTDNQTEAGEENKAVATAKTTCATKAAKKEKHQQQKKENKKKRKGRSLSESDAKHHDEAIVAALSVKEEKERLTKSAYVGAVMPAKGPAGRKARSVSESGDILDANGNLFHFKGILKRHSFNRSVSESGSSMDEHASGSLAVSFDMGVGSFGDIPEEEQDEDSDHVVGSEKKHVTFNDVIRKQLFR